MTKIIELAHALGEEIAKSDEIKNLEAAKDAFEKDAELQAKDTERLTDEMGDLFFALINACRLYGIDPEGALERTNKKFIRRFNHVERRAEEQGKSLHDMTLQEMDSYWDEAKALERE